MNYREVDLQLAQLEQRCNGLFELYQDLVHTQEESKESLVSHQDLKTILTCLVLLQKMLLHYMSHLQICQQHVSQTRLLCDNPVALKSFMEKNRATLMQNLNRVEFILLYYSTGEKNRGLIASELSGKQAILHALEKGKRFFLTSISYIWKYKWWILIASILGVGLTYTDTHEVFWKPLHTLCNEVWPESGVMGMVGCMVVWCENLCIVLESQTMKAIESVWNFFLLADTTLAVILGMFANGEVTSVGWSDIATLFIKGVGAEDLVNGLTDDWVQRRTKQNQDRREWKARFDALRPGTPETEAEGLVQTGMKLMPYLLSLVWSFLKRWFCTSNSGVVAMTRDALKARCPKREAFVWGSVKAQVEELNRKRDAPDEQDNTEEDQGEEDQGEEGEPQEKSSPDTPSLLQERAQKATQEYEMSQKYRGKYLTEIEKKNLETLAKVAPARVIGLAKTSLLDPAHLGEELAKARQYRYQKTKRLAENIKDLGTPEEQKTLTDLFPERESKSAEALKTGLGKSLETAISNQRNAAHRERLQNFRQRIEGFTAEELQRLIQQPFDKRFGSTWFTTNTLTDSLRMMESAMGDDYLLWKAQVPFLGEVEAIFDKAEEAKDRLPEYVRAVNLQIHDRLAKAEKQDQAPDESKDSDSYTALARVAQTSLGVVALLGMGLIGVYLLQYLLSTKTVSKTAGGKISPQARADFIKQLQKAGAEFKEGRSRVSAPFDLNPENFDLKDLSVDRDWTAQTQALGSLTHQILHS